MIQRRLVRHGEFPSQVWEETRYSLHAGAEPNPATRRRSRSNESFVRARSYNNGRCMGAGVSYGEHGLGASAVPT